MPYEALQLVMICPSRSAEAIAAAVVEGRAGSRHDEFIGTPRAEAIIDQPVRPAIRCN